MTSTSIYRQPVVELFTPGTAITARAADSLTKGQFVIVTDGTDPDHVTVTTPQAGDTVFGIANMDTAAGKLVTIERGPARCFRLPTSATIAAGAEIETADDGTPTTAATGNVVAVALHTSTDGHVDVTLV